MGSQREESGIRRDPETKSPASKVPTLREWGCSSMGAARWEVRCVGQGSLGPEIKGNCSRLGPPGALRRRLVCCVVWW